MKEENIHEYFEVGTIPYLPREFVIKDHERMGKTSPYLNEVESDLEEDDDGGEFNEGREEFLKEVH